MALRTKSSASRIAPAYVNSHITEAGLLRTGSHIDQGFRLAVPVEYRDSTALLRLLPYFLVLYHLETIG